MKIFLGSSTESIEQLRLVGSWAEEHNHELLLWDDPKLFLPGSDTLSTLIEIAHSVDTAIFVFGEDDEVWYRQDSVKSPRDNVVLEYGLFAGILGKTRVAICRHGAAKHPSDLHGLNYIDINENRQQAARIRTTTWLNRVERREDDPLSIEIAILRKENERKNEELRWLRQSNADLVSKLDYSSEEDRTFKMLFNFDYTISITEILLDQFGHPSKFKEFLDGNGWLKNRTVDVDTTNTQRFHSLIRKCLRVFRRYLGPKEYAALLEALPPEAAEKILSIPTPIEEDA